MSSRKSLEPLAALLFGGAVAGAALLLRRCCRLYDPSAVNDIHAQINPTRVDGLIRPRGLEELRDAILLTAARGGSVALSGGRHAMGGQQFAAGETLLDLRGLDRVLSFDAVNGLIEVEAGIQWPALVEFLNTVSSPTGRRWAIRQKQTGADRLTLGGALAANVHGRGLRMKPIVGDVERFTLIDASGRFLTCSRNENADLFSLAIGGYGLFGVIYSVTLRLTLRHKVQRVVEVIHADELIQKVACRVEDGFEFGDFQFMTDEQSPDFLTRGVFSCYRPVPDDTPIPSHQESVPTRAWYELLYLAHTDKARAFRLYADYYRSTDGQIYWSDTHQMAGYLDGYHAKLDRRTGAAPATEIITEIFVPRHRLTAFLHDVRDDFRKNGVNLIYGTIRFIERDDETFLAWANRDFACIIFNLCTTHTPQGLEHSAQAFRRLIDLGIRHGGGYYLTYHRYATREQIQTCYPQIAEFLRLKRKYDPAGLFQSDWYRHHACMFEGSIE